MFGLDTIFDNVKSSYPSVGEFFSDLGGMDMFEGGDSEQEDSTSSKPKGAMEAPTDLTNLSDSATMKLYEQLTTATTKQRRDLRQSKLDNRPQSVSFQDTEAMWMRRLNSIAQGQVFTMESK